MGITRLGRRQHKPNIGRDSGTNAGREVVEHNRAISARYQLENDMAADVAGSTGHQDGVRRRALYHLARLGSVLFGGRPVSIFNHPA